MNEFEAGSITERVDLIHTRLWSQRGVVWSRKDIADSFSVSKSLVLAPLSILVRHGIIEQARYPHSRCTNYGTWSYGYIMLWYNRDAPEQTPDDFQF